MKRELKSPPAADAQALWVKVIGPFDTAEDILSECETLGFDPEEYVNSAVLEAIELGIELDPHEAFKAVHSKLILSQEKPEEQGGFER